MLFIIDMQNEYVDKKKGKRYVKGSEKFVEGIIEKIKEYEERDEYIFYTSDMSLDKDLLYLGMEMINNKETINYAEKGATTESKWSSDPYPPLKPYLAKHEIIKKSYYALPPETLLEIQEHFKDKGTHTGTIEFVGVETHICVLANAICIQSTFPNANIVINASLCGSKNNKDHKAALKLMEGLGMEIRR